ncbi:MAG: DUF3048 domain-containing protein [Clostridiales bacterium]|nr:DUF3048 domain-containing protein [Clostridiales bacterium]
MRAVVCALALLFALGLLAGCGAKNAAAPDTGAGTGAGTPAAAPEPKPVFGLTGLDAPDKQAAANKVISVKIENTPEARPQLGIARADVVYESITEGGITRFNCLFQSDIPDEVGPVRSARDSDMTIVPEYGALFFFSGANDQVWARISASTINIMSQDSASDLYHRVSGKVAPHNLYLDLSKAYEQAAKMGFIPTETKLRTLEFGDLPPADSQTKITAFNVPFSGADYNVDWTWDQTAGVTGKGAWLRSIKNVPQTDAADNAQIAAENVVALWVDYVPAPPVPGKGQTYNINLAGSGTACVYRDGAKIEGTWTSDGVTPPRFSDANGNPIPLAVGHTWFQVLPTGTQIVDTPAEIAPPIDSQGGSGTTAADGGTGTGTNG